MCLLIPFSLPYRPAEHLPGSSIGRLQAVASAKGHPPTEQDGSEGPQRRALAESL
jgi:hypothetical protein